MSLVILLTCAVVGMAITKWAIDTIFFDPRSDRGHRRARQSSHHRALAGASAIETAFAVPAPGALPGVTPAGDPSDPRAGAGPGLDPQAKAPDSIEPVVGHRAWGYNNGHLTSSNAGLVWPAGKASEAECVRGHGIGGTHAAPQEGCSCGLYAADQPAGKVWASSASNQSVYVWGTVSGWGKVLKYTRGWKAQYAYPKSLMVWAADSGAAGRAALKLKQNYGCEVQVASATEASKACCPGIGGSGYGITSGLSTTWGTTAQPSAFQNAASQALTNQQMGQTSTTPAPRQNPAFKSYASHKEYMEFLQAEYEKQTRAFKAVADVEARAKKAAQSLMDLGMVLPETVGEELGFTQQFPTTKEQANAAHEALKDIARKREREIEAQDKERAYQLSLDAWEFAMQNPPPEGWASHNADNRPMPPRRPTRG